MKRKWMAIWTAAAAAALCMAGCSGGGEKKETVSAVADGVLTVGIVNGGDIFASKEGDTYSGIEPMLVNALGDALDVTVEYVEVSGTQELLQLLDAGTVDAAVGRIAENDAYSQRYLSTRNYGKKGLYLVTRRNDYTVSLAGFSQMNVGITQAVPSNLRVEIPGLEDVNVSEYPDTAGIPAGLAEEVIAAAVCTEREALGLLSEDVQVQELLGGPREAYVVLFPLGQEELAGYMNQVISQYLDEQAQAGEEEAQEEELPAQTEGEE